MRDKFFQILIPDKEKMNTDAFVRTNKVDEHVIHFKDRVFFQQGGNVSIPVPDVLQQDQSLKIEKMMGYFSYFSME